MRFAFTDDQLDFRDAVRALLAKECTPDSVRAAWVAEPALLDRRAWDSLEEMGALSMLVPEAEGGLGLDFRSLVLVLEETGRAALPHPVVETAAVAAPLGVGGRMVAASFGGGPISCAADADALLVDDGGVLRLHTPDQIVLEPVSGIDGARRLARVTALRADGQVLTEDPAALAAAFDRGALGTAAQLIGLAQAMLDLTVDYAKERRQFGVPIGSFQAVKHHLANALKGLAFARPAVYRAAFSLATAAPTVTRDVSMAKAMASDAAAFVGRQALQCHGAIGYTVEHDLHLYMKRSWALGRAWGDPLWHRDRVARELGI